MRRTFALGAIFLFFYMMINYYSEIGDGGIFMYAAKNNPDILLLFLACVVYYTVTKFFGKYASLDNRFKNSEYD